MRNISQELHPATRAANLQRRLRGLTAQLKRGEAYHIELDAIANELGELAMQLESYDPTCHAFRRRSPGPHGPPPNQGGGGKPPPPRRVEVHFRTR